MAKNNVSSLLTSVDELFTTQEERDIAQRETVIDIPLSEISDFPNHPFKVTVDEKMLEMGYDRVVVVLTKPADYVKKPMPKLFTSIYKRRFPRFYEAFSNRYIMYNAQLERLKELEKQGVARVLRPSEHIKVSKVEKNPDKLESLYQLGIRDAERFLAG